MFDGVPEPPHSSGFDFFGTEEFRDHVDDDRKDGRTPFCAESATAAEERYGQTDSYTPQHDQVFLSRSDYRAFRALRQFMDLQEDNQYGVYCDATPPHRLRLASMGECST